MNESLTPREVEEMPGTAENLKELSRLLAGWRCCKAPSRCGAVCRDDELSTTLADAAHVIGRSQSG